MAIPRVLFHQANEHRALASFQWARRPLRRIFNFPTLPIWEVLRRVTCKHLACSFNRVSKGQARVGPVLTRVRRAISAEDHHRRLKPKKTAALRRRLAWAHPKPTVWLIKNHLRPVCKNGKKATQHKVDICIPFFFFFVHTVTYYHPSA
jgi:hypothetical protein